MNILKNVISMAIMLAIFYYLLGDVVADKDARFSIACLISIVTGYLSDIRVELIKLNQYINKPENEGKENENETN